MQNEVTNMQIVNLSPSAAYCWMVSCGNMLIRYTFNMSVAQLSTRYYVYTFNCIATQIIFPISIKAKVRDVD